MSEAELKKLEELRKLKTLKKNKKEESKKPEEALPKLQADALPPLMMSRKGQFDMIPDFLKQKEVRQDINNLNEIDMMGAAL